MIDHLKKLMATELRRATRMRRFAFLELFAGGAHLSGALRDAGYAVVSLDIRNGALEDHLHPAFWGVIRGWLQGGVIIGVWLGTPCTTWSRALRRPLRSIEAPMGLEDLSPSELSRLQVGNDTFRLSVRVLDTCVRLGIPAYLENPSASIMWHAPLLEPLLQRPDCYVHILDMCRFGTPWRKRTKIAMWGAGFHPHLHVRCTGKGGLCSVSGKPHLVLEGVDPRTGLKRTAVAAAYPKSLSRALARTLRLVAENNHSINRHSWALGVKPADFSLQARS